MPSREPIVLACAKRVLASRKHLWLFALSAGLFALFFSFTGGLLLPQGGANIAPDPVLTALLFAVSLLAGLSVAMAAYASQGIVSNSAASLAGGLLSSACAFCGPLWLSWVGLGALGAALSDYQYLLSVVALVLVGVAINNSARLIAGPNACRPSSI